MDVRGALYGSTMQPISRYGDVQNKISLASAAVFLSKDRFKENLPYSVETLEGALAYYMNLHFLSEARREFSGTPAAGTSTFSSYERNFMDLFYKWQNAEVVADEEVPALEAFDDWLVEEVTGRPHVTLDRSYADDHKWNKTQEYIHEKGILWI